MRCERIQELILTEYADRVLDEKSMSEVDSHIRSCALCKEFQRLAEKTALRPFRGIRRAEPPSYIWERVKQGISAEEPGSPGIGLGSIPEKIFLWLGRIPKPAVAFAAAAAVIVAVLIARPIAQTRAANEYLAEQIDFMMQLDAGDVNGNGNFLSVMDV